jgi:hypothetical protein
LLIYKTFHEHTETLEPAVQQSKSPKLTLKLFCKPTTIVQLMPDNAPNEFITKEDVIGEAKASRAKIISQESYEQIILFLTKYVIPFHNASMSSC